jgi:hypothetical protein
MGQNIFSSLRHVHQKGQIASVTDFFPDLLDAAATAITGDKNASFNDLAALAGEQPSDKDNDLTRELHAIFLLCCKRENIEGKEASLSAQMMMDLAWWFQQAVNAIFKQVLQINAQFNFLYCEEEGLLPEELRFSTYEQMEQRRNGIAALNRTYATDKAYTNKKSLHRGIKVIEIVPAPSKKAGGSGAADEEVHSSAEKGGLVAHVYTHHLRGFDNFDAARVHDYAHKLFDITLIHEIGHLLGLSDRYQFLLTYELGESGQCIKSIQKDLVPYPVSPDIDPDALSSGSALNNLMFGATNYCRELTTYQRKVLLGYLPQEPDYQKLSILLPSGASFYTNSNIGKGFHEFKSLTHKQLQITKHIPLIGLDASGRAYTYTDVDNLEGGTLDYDGANFIYNGEKMIGGANTHVGLAIVDDHGRLQPNANELGKTLFGYSYCDSRTIGPASSLSQGH